MLQALSRAVASIVCTRAPGARAAGAVELAEIARAYIRDVEVADDPIQAVHAACAKGRTVVIAGSIFLIGPLREQLARDILESS
jgi:folylpolyglutamate synthase/dihydropteroate synthase